MGVVAVPMASVCGVGVRCNGAEAVVVVFDAGVVDVVGVVVMCVVVVVVVVGVLVASSESAIVRCLEVVAHWVKEKLRFWLEEVSRRCWRTRGGRRTLPMV